MVEILPVGRLFNIVPSLRRKCPAIYLKTSFNMKPMSVTSASVIKEMDIARAYIK